MKVFKPISSLLFLLLITCASTSGVIYDYNLDVDFNQFETYVLCVEDFTVENIESPNIDNQAVRQLLGTAVALEMENKAHRTNVLKPQLQAGFRIVISEETVEFQNCEKSINLEYWENCKIQEEIYIKETLIVYVADFKTNEVLWHASIKCNLNKPKKKLESYVKDLVKELFDTYPKTQVGKNPESYKTSSSAAS